MIKLQDFAQQCGVTDRAIQKHLKKHEEALAGHFERKGPNGTWLDDYACEFIRSLMKQQPVVVGDREQYVRNQELEAKVMKLQEDLLKAKDQLLGYQELLSEHQTTVLSLEAATKDKEILEGFIADAKAEIRALTDEKIEAAAKAQRELEEAHEREQQAIQAADRERELRQASEAKVEELKKMGLFKRLFWRGE